MIADILDVSIGRVIHSWSFRWVRRAKFLIGPDLFAFFLPNTGKAIFRRIRAYSPCIRFPRHRCNKVWLRSSLVLFANSESKIERTVNSVSSTQRCCCNQVNCLVFQITIEKFFQCELDLDSSVPCRFGYRRRGSKTRTKPWLRSSGKRYLWFILLSYLSQSSTSTDNNTYC